MTDKQARFCEEYMIDLNATQAAIRAGYSPKTAQEQSARLLSNVMVQNRLAQLQAEQSRRTGVSADRVVRELAKIAFANASDLIDPGMIWPQSSPSRSRALARTVWNTRSNLQISSEPLTCWASIWVCTKTHPKKKMPLLKITTYRPLRICCNGLFQTAISRTLKNEHSGSIF